MLASAPSIVSRLTLALSRGATRNTKMERGFIRVWFKTFLASVIPQFYTLIDTFIRIVEDTISIFKRYAEIFAFSSENP